MSTETAGPSTQALTQRPTRLRPRGRARALSRAAGYGTSALLALSFLVSAIFGASESLSALMGFLYLGLFGLALGALGAQLASAAAVGTLSDLTVHEGGLSLRNRFGRREIAKGSLASGWFLPDLDAPCVEFELTNGDLVSVGVRDEAEARAVLDAAGIAPHQRTLRVQLGSALTTALRGLAFIVPSSCGGSLLALSVSRWLHLPSEAMGFLLMTLTAGLLTGLLRVFQQPVLRVGVDGVSVERGLGRTFYAFRDLRDASPRGFQVRLQRADGRFDDLAAFGSGDARRRALCDRINEGILASQRPPDPLSERLSALDLGERTFAAWRESLDELARGVDSYRQTGLSRDELSQAVTDPHGTPDRQIAAAYVLARIDRPQSADRVRIASDAVAHEPVRVALHRAAEGELDEVAIDEALRALGR